MLPPKTLKIWLPSDWITLSMMTALGICILSWSVLASFQSAWAPPTESSSLVMSLTSRSQQPGNLVLGRSLPLLLHHLTESRGDLPDLVTSQKCYSLFNDLHIPIPVDLSFIFSINGFGTWWSMWKAHIFRKALGLVLQQIDAEYEAFEREVFPPGTLHDLLFNFSLNYLSLL
jgi:hypothetical protein